MKMRRETEIPVGTLPDRVLFRTSRTSSIGGLANFVGIEPKRRLSLRSNLFRNVKSPKLAGIAPLSKLFCRARTLSFFRDPS